MSQENKVYHHKHFQMGRGKYTLKGIWTAPSKQLLETYPASYNIQMENRPACCHMTCDHCGTGILIHFIIEDEDKKLFCVGSSCIDKLGQVELITQAKKAKLERDRKIREEKREQARQERHAKYQAEMEKERAENNGKTLAELKQETIKAKQAENKAVVLEAVKEIVGYLLPSNSGFCQDIAQSLKEGNLPKGYGRTLTIEIITKSASGARLNSKKYNEMYPIMEEKYEAMETKLNTLKQELQNFLHKQYYKD